ncbi:hypothetical protein HN51_031324, partial [Arachis hypogaea]
QCFFSKTDILFPRKKTSFGTEWATCCKNISLREVNPLQKVPAIVHGNLKLSDSHAILVYLASALTGIADQWNVVIIHHLLYDFAVNYVIHTTLAHVLGRQLNPKAATEGEKVLLSSLKALEDFWLNGDNGSFLCDSTQPSVADLSMICELMQLEVTRYDLIIIIFINAQVLDERDRSRILSPYKKIFQWIENTRKVKVINLWHIVGFVLYANQEEIVFPPW